MFLGAIARPVGRADNLTAICEPIMYIMWNLQHLITPRRVKVIALLFTGKVEMRIVFNREVKS
jgi:hypothetical protein